MNEQVSPLRVAETLAQDDLLLSLRNLRVLFLPKNSRTGYFSDLLRDAQDSLNWQTHVVGPQAHEGVWQHCTLKRGRYFQTPDFSKRQAWEDDPAACAAIDSFIKECEEATGISACRIILSGERELGRGFSEPIYYWFKTPITRKVLADNAEPTRIVRRMFAFARDTLNEVRPSLVIAGEWADPLWFAFLMSARCMGIACAVNRLSKLWSGRCYWSADAHMYNSAALDVATRKRALNAAVSDRSRERIATFRARPETVGYVKKNWENLDSRGFVGAHRDFVKIWLASARRRMRGRDRTASKPAFQLMGDYYRQAWLNWRQAKLFRRLDEAALRDMKYIYIALHKDPEQALNYQAPFWSNQLNTIALLCGALPNGYRLLIREQRNNHGRRPTSWYKNVARLPGVLLIDGFDDQFKYIRHADLVVTDNGSTGWEGLVLGRRTMTLADTYYDGAGLAHRVQHPEHLAREIEDLLQQDLPTSSGQRDCAQAYMLDAEWECSAPIGKGAHEEALRLLALVVADAVKKSQPAVAQ